VPREIVPPGLPALAGLTIPEFARRYRIGRDAARAMIRRGDVVAINVAATACGRPRWIVTPEALAEFEKRRQSGPAPKPPRRKKRTAVIDFYPD
jgi:hypothetical protein